MVLRPLAAKAERSAASAQEKPAPVWFLVAERQKCRADRYWLISQPDHAKLSGELAANFASRSFPGISPAMARAIAMHDAGWGIFPQESSSAASPRLAAEGKPLAFVECGPRDFVRAWTASIGQAADVSPAGGIIVSRHFCALGSFRLRNNGGLSEDERQLIAAFTRGECERQQRLLAACSCSASELDAWLEVLQFCDLLSLYLCSGVQQAAEFPQRLTDRPVQIRYDADQALYQLDPSPFQSDGKRRTISLAVPARSYPAADGKIEVTTLNFNLV
jgi:hypothetical protein